MQAVVPALLVVVGACSPENAPVADTHVVGDSAGIQVVRNLLSGADVPRLSIRGPVVSIGEVEGSEAEMLSRVGGATRLPGGTIALSDNASSSVRVYDRSGDMLFGFGRRGEGPREFSGVLGPWQVRAGSARLVAYDFRGQKLTALTRDVEFLEAIRLRPHSATPAGPAGVLKDLTVVQVERDWTPQSGEFTPATAFVVAFSPPEWTRDTVHAASTNRRGFIVLDSGREVMAGPLFEPHFSADATADVIVVTDCKSPEYKRLQPDGSVQRIVRWPASDRRVTEEHIRTYREESTRDASPARRQAFEAQLAAAPVNDVFPACDYNHPLLGDAIRVGVDGDVWVRKFKRPSETRQTWLRFRTGVLTSTLQLDDATAVQEFGSDYLLTVDRDELGVERVREYVLEEATDAR